MNRLRENIKAIIFGTNTKAGKLFDEKGKELKKVTGDRQ